jgi:hypothetical protein
MLAATLTDSILTGSILAGSYGLFHTGFNNKKNTTLIEEVVPERTSVACDLVRQRHTRELMEKSVHDFKQKSSDQTPKHNIT